jgi:hypothetical protein
MEAVAAKRDSVSDCLCVYDTPRISNPVSLWLCIFVPTCQPEGAPLQGNASYVIVVVYGEG